MNNKVKNEDTIDLMRLLLVLKNRVWLIILVGLLFACGSAAYTKLCIQPTYTSVSTILVLPKSNSVSLTSSGDLLFGNQISKDYMVLTTSRPVLEEVIDNLGLSMGYQSLRGCISITNQSDTRIMSLSVTMTDPRMARDVVNELAKVSTAYIADKMEVPAPKVIEDGELPLYKNGPDMKKNVMMGLLAGMVLVCGILVVLELMNDAVTNEEDIERYLGIPVLALVPEKGIKVKKKNSRKKRKA